MQFKVGDIVRSVTDHRIILVVVRANTILNSKMSESIGVAECACAEIFTWTLPSYWELCSEEDRLQQTIKEVIKICS